MKVLIAPDSFKGCLSATEVSIACRRGIKRILDDDADISLLPLSDGGDGLLDVITFQTEAQIKAQRVSGPLGEAISARLAYFEKTSMAVIEMAEAAGIHHLEPDEETIVSASTFGVGEQIIAAIDLGASHIVLGLGGSATNDGGSGALSAMGFRFLDSQGNPISNFTEGLAELAEIDTSSCHPKLAQVSFTIACDVDNPLCGESGASAVYGPQKGAGKALIKRLDRSLLNYGRILEKSTKKNIVNLPGAGAAGGMAAGFLALTNSHLEPGFDCVCKILEVGKCLDSQYFDLVITGEGCIDEQTLNGKLPVAIAQLCQEKGTGPVIAICGKTSGHYQKVYEKGISAVFNITPHSMDLSESIKNAADLIADTCEQVLKLHISNKKAGVNL